MKKEPTRRGFIKSSIKAGIVFSAASSGLISCLPNKKSEEDEKGEKPKDEEKKLDKVNPDAVKKKFDDRKDKDIDNDGDVDSSDKFLHKRRKAISKATSEAVTQDDHGEKINQDKKDAAMKKTDQKKDFKSLRAETKIIKLGDKGKTATGKDAGAIDVEPSAKPI